MKLISIFNNKGGVGKTTLTYHAAHALSELGKKVLLIDLDPQCNLTVFGIDVEELHQIWDREDVFVEDYKGERNKNPGLHAELLREPRSIHFLFKPVEDGVDDPDKLPPPISLAQNLDLIPGRLTLHQFENRIARRWVEVFQGDPLALRTVTRIRSLAEEYANEHNYDYVIIDTSPSLGDMNRVIISTVDGFVIPCAPDMFSLYGVRNIGQALTAWRNQFKTAMEFLSDSKRGYLPRNFVRFLGFSIYNAKKYTKSTRQLNEWALARAHYNYAQQIPDHIKKHIKKDIWDHLTDEQVGAPYGGKSIMHTHNTLPALSQKYHVPMWNLPEVEYIDEDDRPTIIPNRERIRETRKAYHEFSADLIRRVDRL